MVYQEFAGNWCGAAAASAYSVLVAAAGGMLSWHGGSWTSVLLRALRGLEVVEHS